MSNLTGDRLDYGSYELISVHCCASITGMYRIRLGGCLHIHMAHYAYTRIVAETLCSAACRNTRQKALALTMYLP